MWIDWLNECPRRQVTHSAVGTNLVGVASPLLNDDIGINSVAKPLPVQTLVAALVVEALVRAVLPKLSRVGLSRVGLSRVDGRCVDVCLR